MTESDYPYTAFVGTNGTTQYKEYYIISKSDVLYV